MSGSRTYPWSGWPPAAQQRLFKYTLLGTAGLCFSVYVGLFFFTGALEQEIAAAKTQYGLVVPIVQDINRLHASQGDLVAMTSEDAVAKILEDRALGDYLVTMQPTRLKEKQEGVEVTLKGLTLIMLTDFLQDVRERAGLQTPEFVLTRNPADPRLADVHLVLAR